MDDNKDKKIEIKIEQVGNLFTGNVDHVEGNNFFEGSNNISNKIGTDIDNSYITQLINSLDIIDKTCYDIKAKKNILDIRNQLNSTKPNVGIIQAAFNNLKRICTDDKFLKAVEVFGNLLKIAIN